VKLRWIKIVICLLPFLVPNKLVAESDCAPITSDVADRLANFVHDKFQFAPETVMKLTSSEVVGETCHRKLHFRSEGNGPVDIVFYLSPDLRFLSRDLLDSTVDAAAEKKAALEKLLEEQRLMQTRLISGKFPSSGPDTASITLTVFADFQCPFCRQQVEMLKEFNDRDVRVVFRHLPLPMHPWARAAAEMSACVYRQSNDAFWFLHDELFREQANLNPGALHNFVQRILAKRTDVDLHSYKKCVASHEAAEDVDRDLAFAQEHKIQATPTVFVNGVRRDGVMRPVEIRRLAESLSSDANREKQPKN
jgi:protein-disulfide isomerase